MNAYRKRPNTLPWPPMLLVGTLVCAIVLDRLIPFPLVFPGGRMLGYLLVILALVTDIWAVATLAAARTTVMPHRPSSHLVTRGPFRFSRNPIYLANLVLLAGLALALSNGWLVLLAIIDGLLTHYLAVRREESHLIAQFGYKYENYCRSVRRWI